MDVQILSGGLDAVMAQHLLDLVNGCAGLQQVLRIGVAQPIGAGVQARRPHAVADTIINDIGAERPMGRMQG